MFEKFNFEGLGSQLPSPHPFELSAKERLEKYPKIAKTLEKLKSENLADFSNKYDTLIDFFDWLALILPENNYAQTKERILESAECFADCIVGFDPLKDDSFEYMKEWNEDQAVWHTALENAIKQDLPEIIEAIGQAPAIELKTELDQLIGEEHKFFSNFALFIACKQTIWPGDKREKVPVEQ